MEAKKLSSSNNNSCTMMFPFWDIETINSFGIEREKAIFQKEKESNSIKTLSFTKLSSNVDSLSSTKFLIACNRSRNQSLFSFLLEKESLLLFPRSILPQFFLVLPATKKKKCGKTARRCATVLATQQKKKWIRWTRKDTNGTLQFADRSRPVHARAGASFCRCTGRERRNR